MSKGPAAQLFYGMIPDLDGKQRLELQIVEGDAAEETLLTDEQIEALAADYESRYSNREDAIRAMKADYLSRNQAVYHTDPVTGEVTTKADRWLAITTDRQVSELDPDGYEASSPSDDFPDEQFVTSEVYEVAWKNYRTEFDAVYGLEGIYAVKADAEFKRHLYSLRGYLTDNRADIESHFESLERYTESVKSGTNVTAHQKKRDWDEMLKIRGEVNGWLAELDAMTESMQNEMLGCVPAENLQSQGRLDGIILSPDWIPEFIPMAETRLDFLDLSVTWGLTAIGLALMLGCCTRLASLGGVAFLISVLLTQPPIPTIYPPASAQTGHALIVDKNFVEMMAMLVLVALPAGRFAGLDYFIYTFIGKGLEDKYCKKVTDGAPKAKKPSMTKQAEKKAKAAKKK
jgi:uncharacterized membrane protein YphA (DoxX/SURF4 family)